MSNMMSTHFHSSKIYLSAIKLLLTMYEFKEPSIPNQESIAKTYADEYHDYHWYVWLAGVGCGWSVYLWKVYNGYNRDTDSLILSKREIYGFSIAFMGHLIRLWAKYTMHRYFTYTVHILKNHELIQTGPYSIVRHPGYLGDVLLWIGDFLITNSYILLVTNFPNVYYSLKRIPTENQLLQEKFGDEYNEYTRKAKYILVPLVI